MAGITAGRGDEAGAGVQAEPPIASFASNLRAFADGLTAKVRGPGLTGEQVAALVHEYAEALAEGATRPVFDARDPTCPTCGRTSHHRDALGVPPPLDASREPDGARAAAHMAEACRQLWLVIADVDGAQWIRQPAEWGRAAHAARDVWLSALHTRPDSADALGDAGYGLWAVLANVSEGSWQRQSAEWQARARIARERWHAALALQNRGALQATDGGSKA